MERARDEQDQAPKGATPGKTDVDQSELQALKKLLSGFNGTRVAGKTASAKSDPEEPATSRTPAHTREPVSDDCVSEGPSHEAPSDGRCVEVIPAEFGGQSPDLMARIGELIERLRAFPNQLLYPLREACLEENGDLQLISDAPRGESLGHFARRNAALRPAHALEIARQILVILAEGQRRQLFHGNLDANKVILERNAPRSADNPHGVCVRLKDFGLAEIFGGEQDLSQGARTDLDQVGRMLAALIAGQSLTAEPETLRSALPADLAPETRRLIQRGLNSPRGTGFERAGDMRTAIESLVDWRGAELQRPSPILRWVAAVSSSALLVVLVLWLRNSSRAIQESGPLTTTAGAQELAPDARLQETSGVSKQAYRESVENLERAQEQLDLLTQRMSQLERDNAKLSIDTEALRVERDSLRARLARPSDSASQQLSPAGNLDSVAGDSTPSATDDPQASAPGNESADSNSVDNVTLLGAALEAPLALGAQAVETLAASVPEKDLVRALTRFRESAVPLLIEAEGQTLNRERLGAIPALAAWSRITTQRQLGTQLASLEVARRYFDRSQPLGIPTQDVLDLVRGNGPRTELAPWRAHLLFRLALENQAGGLLGPVGTEALWLTQEEDGAMSLSLRMITPEDASEDAALRAWDVQVTRISGTGQPNSTNHSRLLQRGRNLVEVEGDQQTLLADLADPALTFEFMPQIANRHSILELLPVGLTIQGNPVASVDVEQFLHEQGKQEALVQRTAQHSAWFLPSLGLARVVDADGTKHRLIFVNSPSDFPQK